MLSPPAQKTPFRSIMAATDSPRLSSKMEGSAMPTICRPRSMGSSFSAALISSAIFTGSHLTPWLGVSVQPYSSLIRKIRPSWSTAYHPTEKGLAYPKSNPRKIRQSFGIGKGSTTWVHRWSAYRAGSFFHSVKTWPVKLFQSP